MENFGPLVVLLIVSLLLFLLLRAVLLWYWKVDEQIKMQRQQNILLTKILAHLDDNKTDTVYYKGENGENFAIKINDVIKSQEHYDKLMKYDFLNSDKFENAKTSVEQS